MPAKPYKYDSPLLQHDSNVFYHYGRNKLMNKMKQTMLETFLARLTALLKGGIRDAA